MPFLSKRIISWWDMNKIAGDYLYHASSAIGRLRCEWSTLKPAGDSSFAGSTAFLTEKQRENGVTVLMYARACFEGANLSNSAAAIDELCGLLRSWSIPSFATLRAADAVSRLDEIDRAVRREMKAVLFILMSPNQAEQYEHSTKDWEDAIERWPKIKTDVEESSRCFAFERYGAAVFHSMLVAEFGVVQIGDFFKVSGDKPGWGCVKRLEAILGKPIKDRSPFEQGHSGFLNDTMRLIHAVKDWRHKISHVDNWIIWQDTDFSPQRAEELILATRGFMRHLAAELPL